MKVFVNDKYQVSNGKKTSTLVTSLGPVRDTSTASGMTSLGAV